jgi:hypothetical protein
MVARFLSEKVDAVEPAALVVPRDPPRDPEADFDWLSDEPEIGLNVCRCDLLPVAAVGPLACLGPAAELVAILPRAVALVELAAGGDPLPPQPGRTVAAAARALRGKSGELAKRCMVIACVCGPEKSRDGLIRAVHAE